MVEPSSSPDQDLTIIISLSNNIIVRGYRPTDVQSLSRHGNNKKIWDNLRNRMPHPYTKDDAQAWIDNCRSPDNHRASGPWTAETGAKGPLVQTNYAIAIDGEACGSIGLDFNDPTDIYARNAEIGYWLAEAHWGKGVMGAVVPAFVEWAWRTFGVLIRLNATVAAFNPGSRKCLEKAGLREEGRKKWGFLKNGVLADEIILGMLRPGAVSE